MRDPADVGWTDICINDMLICMRTTLNLNDALMRRAKQRAASTGQTLTRLIEEALRQRLAQEEAAAQEPFELHWVTATGELQPGVDLTDRDALYEQMEDRR